ncbi:PAS domain S-box protein [Sinorhizobium sp. 8-89]|uniref:PAS domain S-box protein n=1 Tax=Sinorhizobium sp. 8-89 TaxID=3049089 RepID=UPI0028681026|nr:PAS domain S-box protein [Sinorhizobium sp. 8-89]
MNKSSTTPAAADWASRVTRAGSSLGRRERPASTFFLVFAAALVLPVLLFASFLAWTHVEAEQARAVEWAQSLARELSVSIDGELAGSRLVLEALATSDELQRGDLEAFHATASKIARALAVTIVVRAPGEPRQLLNTSAPWGTALPVANPEMLGFERQAFLEKKPVVTSAFVGPMQKRLMVGVIVPVLRDGEVVYFLSFRIPVERLQPVLSQANLDEGWLAAVTDSTGTIVARSADPGAFVGRKAPAEWMSRASDMEGLWRGKNLVNVDVVAAYARSLETNWLTTVSVSMSILNAPIWQALASVLTIGFLLLLVSIVFAYWSGSRLASAIGALQSAGLELERNERVSAVATPVREINAVGRVIASAATEAQRREAHLRSILATVPSAMVVADSRGRIQSFSATAEKLFGFKAGEACGENVSMLMPEPDKSAHDGYIERYLKTGERHIIGKGRVVLGRRKDGSKFPVELYVGEAEADGERLFTAFLQDQTEKQRVEQELRQTQKMEAIGKLTGGVAHDFNNLLTVIKGNLEMLEAKAGDKYRAYVGEAQEAADLAAQLTSSLLAFGRRMPLNPQLSDVGELVAATGDLLRRTLGETIVVRTGIRSGCLAVVDEGQLKNAILNLAINARDAMPKGGTLALEVSRAELDRDYALDHPEVRPGQYVLIAVSDTGTGMSAKVRERAFEPFFTTKPQGAGTGLGLSSVYGFVKQSGGHVALYSEEGQGTTVRIYLPLALEKGAETSETAAPLSLPEGTGELVLVAEDDERVRRVTIARLESLGYRVLQASNGPEALSILDRMPGVGLLFTDVVMPGGMTGAELAAAARQRYPELPVLFTSGYAGPEITGQANSRVAAWLRKPYTVSDLAWALQRTLSERTAVS